MKKSMMWRQIVMELINVRNASLVLYEEVLRKKENLRRDARQFEIRYLQEFGDLLAEVFEAKIECVAVKKRIAYCQRCRNRGQEIDRLKLDQYMNEEMKEYYTHLEEIKDEIRNARKAEAVSALERMRIREIYYRLARKIHPDMRPDLAEDQKLKAYWNRILMAYQCSRLADLEELETLVNMYLTESGIGEADYEIEDVEKKIG